MAKRKNGWTKEKIARYMKEGRGQGELIEYIPWLKIQDVPSSGNVTRLMGWKTKRQHEFLSNLELGYFYLLEWSRDVYDIREQFPLDIELTYKISEEKGIPHSIDKSTNTKIVMTTDFFITVLKNNKKSFLARTVKPSSELEDKRVIEKFEIEREYWNSKGVDWGIITENELPESLIKNIQWVHKYRLLDLDQDVDLTKTFLKSLINATDINISIIQFCNEFDDEYNLETGMALNYFKYFIAVKVIGIDMQHQIKINNLKKSDLIISEDWRKQFDYISG
ncbi:TnsA endonuclease N-terminal domain-containing protein [Rummeliibacillus sp. G93]|uniref:TnsA endonuclease N-terminal domain-containing protein n=1 Tax=Rummeliibacillus sp. G93 TaxID=2939494 RepID=UPI00201BCD56|nr:TnsA endonuclease N-terminal domain-containing protein [Rummeliibacillus sp. G93]UQW97271.1 TnsA endonuclease N-terminal domain-containing protein [Rummeliibacillus sp. G93]